MDIKDSYLHGTVGVVKSISVSADKLKYKLADIAGTVREVTLPVATTSANGLMSSGDKTKLDNLSSTIGNYVTLNTDQEITGTKTFTKQLKFTVAKGTAPFLVTSDTKVTNLNADLLDGVTNGDITAKYINAFTLNTEHTLDNILDGFYNYKDGINPSNVVGNNGAIIQISGRQWDRFLLLFPGNNAKGIRYRNSTHESSTTWVWTSWKTIAFTDSDITGNAATATHASTADKLKTKRKLWGLNFDGSADVSGDMTGVGRINGVFNINKAGSGAAVFNITETNADTNYINLYVTSTNTTAPNSRPLVLQNGYGNVGIGVIAPTQKLEVNGNVKATSFIGNLDGTYVNKLTGYSKATTASDLAATDALNAALGKLEYKAGIAYSWYRTITDDDTDDIINKWDEVVDFVNGLDTDLTDEFVTRKTDLTITGAKIFSNDSANTLILNGTATYSTLRFKTPNYFRTFGINKQGNLFITPSNNWNNEYLIWHAGNDGADSGLDADLLDGLHASYYATASSLGNYLPLAGGVMNSGAIITLNNTCSITHRTATTENAVKTIQWYTGTEHDTTYNYPALIGWHNKGGDGSGAICLVPNPQDAYWWEGVGLRISKTNLSFNLHTILTSNNYTDYTVKKDGTGATGTWGISITGNAGSASTSAKLSSTTVISAKALSLSNASWTDTGYTFASLASGTYAIQVTCGNLVASGIMSVYKNIDDTAGDEIPLHVYHDSTQPWRPYLRTSGKKLLISSNDGSATSRKVTIKIALIL